MYSFFDPIYFHLPFFWGGDRMGWCLNGSGTNDVVSVWKKRNSRIIKMPIDLLINCNFC